MPDLTLIARVRAQTFWYRDGLSDIYIGIIVLFLSVNNLVIHFGNEQSPWFWPGIFIYLLVFCIVGFRAPRFIATMRERITYPRIGYAEPGESVREFSRAIVALSVLAILGLLVAVRYGGWDKGHGSQNVPVVTGLLISVIGMYTAVRYGVLRHLLIGLFSVVLALVIDNKYPTSLGRQIWFVAVGCAFVCSGGVTTWNFVRTTPLAGTSS